MVYNHQILVVKSQILTKKKSRNKNTCPLLVQQVWFILKKKNDKYDLRLPQVCANLLNHG